MAGIYLHIPFCKQKCTYCDFHFSTTFQSYRGKMLDAIAKEIHLRAQEFQNDLVETIYFGGGTPSLLTQKELTNLFSVLLENHTISPSAEITLEANPDDISTQSLSEWKKLGFNRLSIGIQSFREEDLDWMNRAHSAEEAKKCVQLAQAEGFENISVDLIYGLPNLSKTTWINHIQTVIDFGVPHVSAYCLTVENKTLLEKKVQEGSIVPSDEDQQSDQFLLLVETLRKAGYEQYEISNFCLPGNESCHNSAYWKGNKYMGIGPSAHSFDGVNRRFNVANNHQYMQFLQAGKAYFETEYLTPVMRFNEVILTGLRTKWGVQLNDLKAILPLSKNFLNQVEKFEKNGWLCATNETIFLENDGWLMADYMASELFESAF
jgi:oxygen-independent coproporphyrinogen III oxidase